VDSSPSVEGSFFSFSGPSAPPPASDGGGLFGDWGGLFSGGLGLGFALGSGSQEAAPPKESEAAAEGYTDM